MATIANFREPKIELFIARPDGVTWEDVTSYVSRVRWQTGDVLMVGTGNTGVDGVARTLEFTLRNDGTPLLNYVGWEEDDELDEDATLDDEESTDENALAVEWLTQLLGLQPISLRDSFAPRDRLSQWNWWDDNYEPLLDANREVVLKVSDDGGQTSRTEFHGYLGERFITDGATITCFASDLSKPLRRKFIKVPREYGSAEGVPVEDVIQAILDDNMGEDAYTLYVPEPTEAVISSEPEPWTVEYMSVWDAIQKAAAEIGYWLGFRWNNDIQEYVLTLLEPPTDKTTADFELDWMDDFYSEEEEITDQYVRNDVTVYYRAEDGTRRSVNVQDQTSIAKFGESSMLIEEKNADLIRTEAGALRLANSALKSLAWMTGETRINMPYLPGMDIFTTFRRQNLQISSEWDFYAVHSLSVTFDFEANRFRAECLASGQVITGRSRWLRMETRPGSPSEPEEPKPPTLGQPGTPVGLAGNFFGLDAVFRWNVASYKHWQRDRVEVWTSGVLRRVTYTTSNEFVYTLDMNREDHVTPVPQVELRVYHEYTTGALSPPAIVAVSHPTPNPPVVNVVSTMTQIHWAVISVLPVGWTTITVEIGESYSQAFSAPSGIIDALENELGEGESATFEAYVTNVFGQSSDPFTDTVTVVYIDREQLKQELQDELDDTAQRLDEVEAELENIGESIGELGNIGERLEQVEAELVNAGERLDAAELSLVNAGERLDEAESRLDDVEGIVSDHSASIEILEEEIVLKASQGELDALAQRVTYNEGELSIHASEIAARVKQEVFDILEGRVTANEGELAIHADMIAARVTQAVFDVLEQRVAHNEGELVIHADQIAARVTQEVFDLLEERVTFNEGELVVHAGLIAARVTQEVFDQLEGRVTINEGELAVHSDLIAARVTQEVFDQLEGRVTVNEGELSIHADQIAARVTQEVFNVLEGRVTANEGELSIHADLIAARVTQEVFDVLEERVTANEGELSIHADLIAARVTQEVFNVLEGRVTANEGELAIHADQIAARVTKSVFDVVEGRVTQAESTLSLHTDQIASKVEQTEFDAVEQRLSHAESTISQQADEIELRIVAFKDGQPLAGARLAVAVVDGEGRIMLDADEVLVPKTLTVGNIAGIDQFQHDTTQLAFEATKEYAERKILKSPHPPQVPQLDDYWQDTSAVADYAAWLDTADADETSGLDEDDEFDEEDDAVDVIAAFFGEPTETVTAGNALYRWDGSQWVLAGDVTGQNHAKDQHDFNVLPGVAGGGAVKIDHTGAWGYNALGQKRAGFGTDGRWIAGGGRVLGDETGVSVNDGEEDRAVFGDLSGRMWKGRMLPPGTYGLYTDNGYFAGELMTILGLQNQVLDGTIIDLSEFGWRHDYELVVTPVEFTVNTPATGQMLIRSYGEMIGPNKFKVRCLAFAPGAALSIGGSTNGKLNQQGSTTSVVYPPEAANMTTIKVRGTLTMQSNLFGGDAEAAVEIADLNPDNTLAGDWQQIYRRTIGARSFDWNTETFETPAVSTGGKRVAVRMRCTRAHGSGDNMRITNVTITGDQYFNIDGVPHNPASTSSGFRAAYVVKEAEV